MIYSQWRPDRGGYDYFDVAAERRGLGDDLPVPRLGGGTDIGVPSTEAGRPMPSGARHIGSGPLARGSIAPMSRAGLGAAVSVGFGDLVMTAVGVAVGWWIWGRKKSS